MLLLKPCNRFMVPLSRLVFEGNIPSTISLSQNLRIQIASIDLPSCLLTFAVTIAIALQPYLGVIHLDFDFGDLMGIGPGISEPPDTITRLPLLKCGWG
jgi:hypothetical protein